LREYAGGDGIGNERTVEEYIDNIVSIFRECVRITKPTGTIVFNIGDKYLYFPNSYRESAKPFHAGQYFLRYPVQPQSGIKFLRQHRPAQEVPTIRMRRTTATKTSI
jgi:hypothetical protein